MVLFWESLAIKSTGQGSGRKMAKPVRVGSTWEEKETKTGKTLVAHMLP